jgi:alpha-D-ribose 1-methylphosphonate 5-triphosphate diphosphatase
VSIAEFPTTEEAAEACGAAGIAVIMGAPNLVRGGSHSGNVAARTLAETDRLDILSSDYVPSALLLAAVKLGDIWSDLPRGIRTVTRNPAESVGLSDRGALEVGRRADLLRFRRLPGGVPVPVATWVRSERVG